MSEDNLDTQAIQELLSEAKRGKERAKDMGTFGWLKPKVPSTNKRFLHRTLMGTFTDLKKQQRRTKNADVKRAGGEHNLKRKSSSSCDISNKSKHGPTARLAQDDKVEKSSNQSDERSRNVTGTKGLDSEHMNCDDKNECGRSSCEDRYMHGDSDHTCGCKSEKHSRCEMETTVKYDKSSSRYKYDSANKGTNSNNKTSRETTTRRDSEREVTRDNYSKKKRTDKCERHSDKVDKNMKKHT